MNPICRQLQFGKIWLLAVVQQQVCPAPAPCDAFYTPAEHSVNCTLMTFDTVKTVHCTALCHLHPEYSTAYTQWLQ